MKIRRTEKWHPFHAAIQIATVDHADQAIAHSIFGTDDGEQIAHMLNQFCLRHLDSPVANCLSVYFSVGATFVVQTDKGKQIVIKAHGQNQNIDELHCCYAVQSQLAQEGFPCPDILVPPATVGETVIVIQSYIPHETPGDMHHQDIRRASANGLAQLITHLKKCDTSQNLGAWMPSGDRLWPEPHNCLFDFNKTTPETDTIDGVAREAKIVVSQTESDDIIGHSDWSVHNMSFRDTALICVYDWNSLCIGYEGCFVAGAACTFLNDYRHGTVVQIQPEQAKLFMADYESARGCDFTDLEHRLIGAAATYAVGYWARCVLGYKGESTSKVDEAMERLFAFRDAFQKADC